MKTRPTLIKIGLVGLILFTAVSVMAQPQAPDFAPPAPGTPDLKLQKMQLMLDLTPHQVEQISRLQVEHRARIVQLHEQTIQLRRELRDLQQAEQFDRLSARELAHQQAELRVDRMAQRHAIRQQVEAILTPEQLNKQERYRELRRARHEQRRGWEPPHRGEAD